jgi:toxin ParE1/3/4
VSDKFILSYQAKEDLASIWQFTYQRWSEVQADRYIETLFSYLRLLESQPQIGKKVNYGTLHLQQFLAESHLVFYRRGTLHIEIVRVLHKNTNFIKLLEVAS